MNLNSRKSLYNIKKSLVFKRVHICFHTFYYCIIVIIDVVNDVICILFMYNE